MTLQLMVSGERPHYKERPGGPLSLLGNMSGERALSLVRVYVFYSR